MCIKISAEAGVGEAGGAAASRGRYPPRKVSAEPQAKTIPLSASELMDRSSTADQGKRRAGRPDERPQFGDEEDEHRGIAPDAEPPGHGTRRVLGRAGSVTATVSSQRDPQSPWRSSPGTNTS